MPGGSQVPAQAGQIVYQADASDRSDGRVGVTLKDDTRVARPAMKCT
jgi:hypothetical protein